MKKIREKYKQQFAFSMVLILLLLGIGCKSEHQILKIGSPHNRYDHNRTKKIIIKLPYERIKPILDFYTLKGKDCEPEEKQKQSDFVLSISKLENGNYIPKGSKEFPSAQFEGEGNNGAPDKLPAANIVPVFTGVRLPLSDKSVPNNGKSDRADLIDYLSAGPLAHAGIKPKKLTGMSDTIKTTYKDLLDFLGSKEKLTGDRKQIIERFSPDLEIETADEVVDSRYRIRSFSDVLGLRFKEFWFILYKLPGLDYYSRLVVVPVRFKGQKIKDKGLE